MYLTVFSDILLRQISRAQVGLNGWRFLWNKKQFSFFANVLLMIKLICDKQISFSALRMRLFFFFIQNILEMIFSSSLWCFIHTRRWIMPYGFSPLADESCKWPKSSENTSAICGNKLCSSFNISFQICLPVLYVSAHNIFLEIRSPVKSNFNV